MAKLDAGSTEAARIDEALARWQQGDIALEERWFVHVADVSRPLTESASESTDTGILALTSEAAGLVVITQTCDIVRGCTERPYVEISPLVEVTDDAMWRDVTRERRPALATLPAVMSRRLAVDLDRVMTVEKSIVAAWQRTRGIDRDSDVRAFANALSRKRARFAFPDDFTRLLRKLQSRLVDKHGKDSLEGRALHALREIRVQASPHWNADSVQIMFLFLLDDERSDLEDREWRDLRGKWLALVPEDGRFAEIDGIVTTLDDMTGADYVSSDRLDLDHLSRTDSDAP